MRKSVEIRNRSAAAAALAASSAKADTTSDAASGPVVVPDPARESPHQSGRASAGLAVAGVLAGLAVHEALSAPSASPAAPAQMAISTVAVERKNFEHTLRAGGTVGATNFAMIRAPRMRGGRDRGGGGSLTIQSLAEAGSIVQEGDVVAVFESRRTADVLDNYESQLAQARRRAASQKANLLISAGTLLQQHRKAEAEADKSALELRTAEVKSEIQAEILALLAQQNAEAARQLKEEVRLAEIADQAAVRSLDLDVKRNESRLDRTKSDLEKMHLRTPVSGLVVVETTYKRDGFSQAAAGDQVNPGSYFLRIVDLSSMAVFADVNQADTQRIQLGADVKVGLDAYPDIVFDGRVTSVGAMAVSGGSSGGGGRGMRGSRGGSSGQWIRTVPIQVEILSTDDRIRPDLSASADIVISRQQQALVIPRAALGDSGGQSVVWVSEGDGFAERRVEIGLVGDTEVTVLSGLSEGEVIAAQGVVDESRLIDLPEDG
ncbi:MAG: efflux RND transporter periplasmic adaptor subunit [Bryobacterales bacterium]|nr:efflux RND transporter periplasmic adaptor subunit [Bryobacterales bacterium]